MFYTVINARCPCGGTGRRAGFKIQCRKACRFDSDRGHHFHGTKFTWNIKSSRICQMGTQVTHNAKEPFTGSPNRGLPPNFPALSRRRAHLIHLVELLIESLGQIHAPSIVLDCTLHLLFAGSRDRQVDLDAIHRPPDSLVSESASRCTMSPSSLHSQSLPDGLPK